MESMFLEFYQLDNSQKKDFLQTLSDEELLNLSKGFRSCVDTLEELISAYNYIQQVDAKKYEFSVKVLWFFKKSAKKEWEEACRAAESEFNNKVNALKGTYIWNLLDIKMAALIVEHHYYKKDSIRTRFIAAAELRKNIIGDISPLFMAEIKSRT